MDWMSNLFVVLFLTTITGTVFWVVGMIFRMKWFRKDTRLLRGPVAVLPQRRQEGVSHRLSGVGAGQFQSPPGAVPGLQVMVIVHQQNHLAHRLEGRSRLQRRRPLAHKNIIRQGCGHLQTQAGPRIRPPDNVSQPGVPPAAGAGAVPNRS